MKIFKWIYYPILILLTAAFITLGFTGVALNGAKSDLPEDVRKAVDGHITKITGFGSRFEGNEENLSDTYDYIRSELRTNEVFRYRSTDTPDSNGLNSATAWYPGSDNKPLPSVVRQDARILQSTAEKMSTVEDGTYYVNRTVTNVVAVVPGSDTAAKYADRNNEELSYGDAILFTANYDTSVLGSGAADNTAAVANLMEIAKQVAKKEGGYKNDFVFLFTAGGEEGSLGAAAFKYQFTGFDGIASRVKLAFNFDAVGQAGALILSEVTGSDTKLVSAFASMSGKAYASSVFTTLFAKENKLTDFEIYNDVAAMNFVTVNNKNSGTVYDTAENLSPSVVNSIGSMMNSAVGYFGDRNLGEVNPDNSVSGPFFNYLGGTVSYANFVPYIFAGLIIAMLGVIVFFSLYKKSLDIIKALLGAAVQLLTMAATLVCAYIGFLIVTLLLSGFEVINIHAIGAVVYTNVGLLIFAIIFALALSVVFYSIFKKVFAVRAADVVRGNALLTAVLAVVFAFALPAVSHLFFIVAFVELAVMIATMFARKAFKEQFGFSIEKLFLYTVPAIFMLPVLCGDLFLASSVAPAVLLPLYLMMFMLYFGTIMPYADYLKRPIGKLVAALPERTVRVERMVTEEQPRKDMPSKTETVTHAKIFKEKEKRTYRNAYGITAVAAVSAVAVILFSAFGAKFGVGVSSNFSHADEIYKDALVYVSDNGTSTLEIHDLDAYKYVARYFNDFTWDSEKNAYVRFDSNDALGSDKPTVTADETNKKLFTVKPSTVGKGTVAVKLSGFAAGSVDKVTFRQVGTRELEYDLAASDEESFTFILPFGTDSEFTLEVDCDATSLEIEVEQRGYSLPQANNHSVFSVLQEVYSDNDEVNGKLTMRCILKTKSTFTL